ncbi:hypothetical protein ACFV19_30485 [Streptomyces griseoluteus]|uniref:hypothetical protein n=1 Tax=Streptomyces griseoluteus TaxID=29306 RepID=UPI00368BCEEC
MKSVRSYLAIAAPLSAILAVGICGVTAPPPAVGPQAPASAVRADDSGWGRVVTDDDSGWGRAATAGGDGVSRLI